MPSFQIAIEPNRKAAARFVSQVRRSLQKTFTAERERHGLTQAEIARMLNVNRSVINRELKGFKDITLGRVAELCWAMGKSPRIVIDDLVEHHGSNCLSGVNVPQPLTNVGAGNFLAASDISSMAATPQMNIAPQTFIASAA